MTSTLILGGKVYAPGIPEAQALIVESGRIAWIGDRQTAKSLASSETKFVDFEDAFISPGFVDAHVHLSSTGALQLGHSLNKIASWSQFANLVNAEVAAKDAKFLFMFGWDDSDWPDSRENFKSQLSASSLATPMYLARVDGHSAVANLPQLELQFDLVSGNQRQTVWEFFTHELDADFTSRAIVTALQGVARTGIVSVHENGGRNVSSEADFQNVISLQDVPNLPKVIPYWADSSLELANDLGAFGVAGDYNVDGSLGSRTAWLTKPYLDAAETSGLQYLSSKQIAEHLINATNHQVQAGFHAIGDAACEEVHQGFLLALESLSPTEIRSCRHRIEHLTLPSTEAIALFAELGVVASVQPSFDARWGRSGGMYEQRLGAQRLSESHPFLDMIKAGMTLAFGSDSPVTTSSPWDWIRAATMHNQENQRISSRAAFTAATRGGHRAAKDDESGVLAIGMRADLAVWQVDKYEPQEEHGKISSWSTDPRSGTHSLPDLTVGNPQCLATIRSGAFIFDGTSLSS